MFGRPLEGGGERGRRRASGRGGASIRRPLMIPRRRGDTNGLRRFEASDKVVGIWPRRVSTVLIACSRGTSAWSSRTACRNSRRRILVHVRLRPVADRHRPMRGRPPMDRLRRWGLQARLGSTREARGGATRPRGHRPKGSGRSPTSFPRPSPALVALLSSSCLGCGGQKAAGPRPPCLPIPGGTSRAQAVRRRIRRDRVARAHGRVEPAAGAVGTSPAREGAERRPLDPESIAVRLLLGRRRPRPRSWNGRVEVDQGEVVGVEGWRFRARRRVTGPDAWEARSLYLIEGQAKAKARRRRKKAAAARRPRPRIARRPGAGPARSSSHRRDRPPQGPGRRDADRRDRAGRRRRSRSPTSPRRDRGATSTAGSRPSACRRPPPLADGPAPGGLPRRGRRRRGGRLGRLRRPPATAGPRSSEALDASGPRASRRSSPTGGGDQVKLRPLRRRQAPATPLDVTGPGLDVWRPAVAVDGAAAVVVAWSENRDGNWDLVRRGPTTPAEQPGRSRGG